MDDGHVERVKMNGPQPPIAFLCFSILCIVQLLHASTCDVARIPQWRQRGAEQSVNSSDRPMCKNSTIDIHRLKISAF